MVGGIVYCTYKYHTRKSISVIVEGIGCESGEFMEIEIVDDGHDIQPGDSIWWQSRTALWTPKDESSRDVKIDRVGYSSSVPME